LSDFGVKCRKILDGCYNREWNSNPFLNKAAVSTWRPTASSIGRVA
jgi:hypothetical protein